jgi:hypothetical protein
VAAALKGTPGLDLQLVDGQKGEFTVLVDGREVARKGQNLPDVHTVVTAVQDAAHVRQMA